MIQDPKDLLKALGNNSSKILIDKPSVANQTLGNYTSLWRATGQPGQGAIPTAAAVPTSATLGSMGFANQVDPVKSYFGWAAYNCQVGGNAIEIHDRLAHMGGLSLVSTAVQNANIDLETLGVAADRIGEANYSDVTWFLEVYADGGATASNATINVTYDDDSTGNLSVVAVGGTLRASRMIPLDILRPAAAAGKNIKGINTVQNSASTGTAGNFGFTATRQRTTLPTHVNFKMEVAKWAEMGFPNIPNDACIVPMIFCTATTSGIVKLYGKIAHG